MPKRVSEYRVRYQGQFKHQTAALYLDLDEKTFKADYNSSIGAYTYSEREYYRRILTFPFNPESRLSDVRTVLKKATPIAERILAGYSCIWDGNNFVGRFDKPACNAIHELERLVESELNQNNFF